MARTAYTVQSAALAGTALTFAAPTLANDSAVPNAGRVLLVNNASASAVTVTLHSNYKVHNLTVPDRTVSVPAGSIGAISINPTATEHLQSDGTFWIDYSSITTVTVAFVSVP
jgi:hypothetical protein